MKKDLKYILYLSLAAVIYLVIKLLSPRELDWTITYHPDDRNPYGGYALGQLIPKSFSDLTTGNYTLYEWYDTMRSPVTFLSISTTFQPGDEDAQSLLKNIEKGGTAFISAQYFYGLFADTLNLYTSDYFFETETFGSFNQNDTSELFLLNPQFLSRQEYHFNRKNIHNYFADFDSTRTQLVATNDLDLPVTIKLKWGAGTLYLNSTPLIFTNIYLLQENNHELIERMLSHLPDQDTYWTAFYQLGRMEARTPLRFILTTEPLRWAYYISILSLLLFMIFESKRRQRTIPVIKPLANTSIEFVTTIGNLYYQANDHKNIAEKRIAFLVEKLRSKHGINVHHPDEEAISSIARKTGNSLTEIQELFDSIEEIHRKNNITENELKDLNRKIDKFNH